MKTRGVKRSLACFMLGFGCFSSNPGFAARSETVERSVSIGPFVKIQLESSDRVEVRQGRFPSVVIRGAPKAVQAAKVAVLDDSIIVTRSTTQNPAPDLHDGFVVEITIPVVQQVAIRGSGEVQLEGMNLPSFLGRVDGSGTLDFINASVDKVSFQVNGSGTVQASGTARSMNVEMAGSGSFYGPDLLVRDLNVHSSGSGSVLASANHETVVSVSGSGLVKVRGGSNCQTNVSGAGKVKCD